MKNFRTFDSAVEFYRLSCSLSIPAHLSSQLVRAGSSIALNLAEGRGKPTKRDQLKFFHIAMGSLRECQAILILAEMRDTESWRSLDKLGAQLYRLIKGAG